MHPLWIVPVIAFASPDPGQGHWLLSTHAGRSQVMLGSTERRNVWANAISYSRPDPKMKAGTRPGNLDLFLYYEASEPTSATDTGSPATEGWGFIATASWVDMWTPHVGSYFRVGWGIQVANRPSPDLDSRVNSSPTMGFGLRIDYGTPVYIGFDYLHLSNAGLVGRNAGQNQLVFSLAVQIK